MENREKAFDNFVLKMRGELQEIKTERDNKIVEIFNKLEIMNLEYVKTNVTFSEALTDLKTREFGVKFPEWDGYWFLKGGKIRVMTGDGAVLDTPWLTDVYILREDCQVIKLPHHKLGIDAVSELNKILREETYK